MRALFFDDEKERHKQISKFLENDFDEVHYAFNYSQCIYKLQNFKFDVVMLDHDIIFYDQENDPENILIDENEEKNGYDVAEFLAHGIHKQDRQTQFIIHSLNPAGRKNMWHTLNYVGFNAVEMPFHMLVNNLKGK